MACKQGKAKGVRMIDKIRELHIQGLNKSQIARALGICRNSVAKYLRTSTSPVELLRRPYEAPWSGNVDWDDVKSETNRGVKLAHYWEEHVDIQKQIPYVSFWREFKRRFPEIPIDLHKVYEPGLRCEFDYKGRDSSFGFCDPDTGDFVVCRLFGNVLCFSQLLFVRATLSEKQGDVLDAVARSYEYFGGVPHTTIFDNAKAQVVRADYHDADLNPEFAYFTEVYATAPIAARPRSPKDKNVIENALGVFSRWAFPKLKKKTFYSLAELNEYLFELCNEFNNRVQRKYGLSRREKFITGEKDRLKSLPDTPYFNGEWRRHKPHADCHIQYRYNFYSVPHECRGSEVDVRLSGRTIEIYQDLKRVAIHHLFSNITRGRYVTNKQHLPESHLAMLEKTPQYVIDAADNIGPNTKVVVSRLINEAIHPLMYLRRCQGLLRLKKRYSQAQLEQACEFFKDVTLRDIKLSNIERVMQVNRQSVASKKHQRQQIDNLRGQSHWGEFIN